MNLAQYLRHLLYLRMRGREKVVSVESQKEVACQRCQKLTGQSLSTSSSNSWLVSGHSLVADGWLTWEDGVSD